MRYAVHQYRMQTGIAGNHLPATARGGVAVSASEGRTHPRDGGLLHDAPGFRETYIVEGAPAKAGFKPQRPRPGGYTR